MTTDPTRPDLALLDPMTLPEGDRPALYPFPTISELADPDASPRRAWKRWWAAEKEPLIVRAELVGHDAPRVPGPYHLDAALSVAAVRGADAAWMFNGQRARVIPLPLDLLGVVHPDEGKRARRTWPKLPVWASTPFEETRPGVWEALCVGNLPAVRELASYLHEIGETPARFTVHAAPLPVDVALEIIRERRPMPGRDERFTPPYWFDWMNRHPRQGAEISEKMEEAGA